MKEENYEMICQIKLQRFAGFELFLFAKDDKKEKKFLKKPANKS